MPSRQSPFGATLVFPKGKPKPPAPPKVKPKRRRKASKRPERLSGPTEPLLVPTLISEPCHCNGVALWDPEISSARCLSCGRTKVS